MKRHYNNKRRWETEYPRFRSVGQTFRTPEGLLLTYLFVSLFPFLSLLVFSVKSNQNILGRALTLDTLNLIVVGNKNIIVLSTPSTFNSRPGIYCISDHCV